MPQGTGVAADFPAQVILVDYDPDRDGGWGTRVFLASGGPVFVYAHLQNVGVRPGQALDPGAVFAEVGGPPDNGNWHPHLHVQAIRAGCSTKFCCNGSGSSTAMGTLMRVPSCDRTSRIPGLTSGCKFNHAESWTETRRPTDGLQPHTAVGRMLTGTALLAGVPLSRSVWPMGTTTSASGK